jgi:hypothetical protein
MMEGIECGTTEEQDSLFIHKQRINEIIFKKSNALN